MTALFLAWVLAGTERCYGMRLAEVEVGWVCVSLHDAAGGPRLDYSSTALVRRGPAVVRLTSEATALLATDLSIRSLHARRFEGRTQIDRVEAEAIAALPSSLATARLSETHTCLAAVEETTGRQGRICGIRDGRTVRGDWFGSPFDAILYEGEDFPRALRFTDRAMSFIRVDQVQDIAPPPELFADPLALDGKALHADPARFEVPIVGLSPSANQSVARRGNSSEVTWRAVEPGSEDRRQEIAASDEPLSRQASDLCRDLGVWAGARILARWVSGYITDRRPADDEIDATAVVRTRRASCRGHVALFLALAGRAGIPAREVVGLVVDDGRLYPHAWAEVRVGGAWYSVDPTEGSAPPRAPRIALGAGPDAGDRLLEMRRSTRRIRVLGLPHSERSARP